MAQHSELLNVYSGDKQFFNINSSKSKMSKGLSLQNDNKEWVNKQDSGYNNNWANNQDRIVVVYEKKNMSFVDGFVKVILIYFVIIIVLSILAMFIRLPNQNNETGWLILKKKLFKN